MRYNSDCDGAGPPKVDIRAVVGRSDALPRDGSHFAHLLEPGRAPGHVKLAVVGAGLIGVGIAARARDLGWGSDTVVLDPHETFAEQFRSRAWSIGQTAMRSPYTHHLAPDGDLTLADYGRLRVQELTSAEESQLRIARLFERSVPPLDLFLGHTSSVIRQHRLHQHAFRFHVSSVTRCNGGWVLESPRGQRIVAQYVVLALGQSPRLSRFGRSPWDPDSSPAHWSTTRKVLVAGGGNTAAQLIVGAILSGRRVIWVVRREPRFACTDIPHAYFRSEGQIAFARRSLDERTQSLAVANGGSGMPEHYRLFRQLERNRLLEIVQGAVIHDCSTARAPDARYKVALSNGRVLVCDDVVEAYGLELASLPRIYPPLHQYGQYPVLSDETLEAVGHPGLFVASAHAALALGAAAKLVDGARLANERIFSAIETVETGSRPRGTDIMGPRRPRWGKLTPVRHGGRPS